MKRLFIFPLSVFFSLFVLLPNFAHAARNADVVTFLPTNDGGRYVTLHQSSTLQQLRFSAGLMLDYAYHPFELADLTGTRVSGIVDHLAIANLGAALGITDWWQIGGNFGVAGYQSYREPNASAANFGVSQNLYGKLIDPHVDMKFRLVDIDRHRVGLALVPFIYFPLGAEQYFLGNGMYSPGANLVLDFDIRNRVFFTLNAGYRYYSFVRYNTDDANAYLSDTINTGLGMSVKVTDSFSVITEAWHEGVIGNCWRDSLSDGPCTAPSGYFKNQLQNPAEFLVAGRVGPQNKGRGWTFTFGGGRGFTNGVGSPIFRVFAGVNYRKPGVVTLPQPVEVEAVVEEKIVITQKIHFEFNRAVIRDISKPIVDDVALLLQENPQIKKIRVEGHTDWISSDAYNQKLSERRAHAVRDYLIAKGIAPERIEAVGYGETRPIADNTTAQGRARNRRTEFTVVEIGE